MGEKWAMDEPPSDSGAPPDSGSISDRFGQQLRRPAVWGLLLLILAVLALQVWLLYL